MADRDNLLPVRESAGLPGGAALLRGVANWEAFVLKTLGLRPRPGSVIPGVTPLAATWLGPQPLGVINPTYFGLPEDYLFGYTPHEFLHGVDKGLLDPGAVREATLRGVARFERFFGLPPHAGDLVRSQPNAFEIFSRRLSQQLAADLQAARELQLIDYGLLPSGVTRPISDERASRLRQIISTLGTPTGGDYGDSGPVTHRRPLLASERGTDTSGDYGADTTAAADPNDLLPRAPYPRAKAEPETNPTVTTGDQDSGTRTPRFLRGLSSGRRDP